MPYIPEEQRRRLDSEPVGVTLPLVKGELTYVAFKAALNYLVGTGLHYQDISDSIAALRDAADEMRNRVLVPYEKKARLRSGDMIPAAILEELND